MVCLFSVLLRDCSPKDKEYHRDDVLRHLLDFANASTIKYAFDTAENPEEFFTKRLPEIWLDTRTQILDSFREGLTLDGYIPLCETFRNMSLEQLQHVAFSSPLLLENVKKILKPNYCESFNDYWWKENGKKGEKEEKKKEEAYYKHLGIQKAFFENILLEILEEKENDKLGDEKEQFLSLFVNFCTGFNYLPDLKAHPNFKIVVEFNLYESAQRDAYPVAHTCANTLKLPGLIYSSKEVFTDKLCEAIVQCSNRFDMA